MTRETRDTRSRTFRPTTVPTVLAISVAFTAGASAPSAVAMPDVPAAPTPIRATAAAPGTTVVRQSFGGTALPSGWKAVSGAWKVRNGRLVGDGGTRARITFGTQLIDYRFEATARFESVDDTSRWFALGLDLPSSGATPWWIATLRSRSTAANGVEFAQRTTAGTWNVTDTAAAPAAAGTGKDVRVRVDVHGMKATWYLDGRKVLSTNELRRSANGRQALLVDGATVAFDDVRVTALPSLNPYLRGPGEPALAVAHRGASAAAPENTLAAQELARRAGADLIETDAQISEDGVPYVMHDSTVDRTTNGTGDLTTLTSAQLDKLDAGSWFSSAYKGEHVPTLRAQGADLKARGGKLLLEIKRASSKDQVARMFDALRAAGVLSPDRVFVQSFSKQHLKWARELAPTLPRGYLTSTLDADPVAVARDLGLTAYNPKASALTARPSVVGDLHRSGVATMAWTVDEPAQWKTLDALGVDAVITNRSAELIAWQQTQQTQQG
ncbi:glycerophosphodiester phosphodiesterase family protein [Streptomyces sp. NPDC002734]|uniref:glycerophosphodiester phosphodiesterase family protein n=1 Tax=Streptomyces sp. NPDC002734 TaxID=3154426 RepID=UPI00331EA532